MLARTSIILTHLPTDRLWNELSEWVRSNIFPNCGTSNYGRDSNQRMTVLLRTYKCLPEKDRQLCDKRSAYTERPLRPPSSKKRPHFYKCTCLGENIILDPKSRRGLKLRMIVMVNTSSNLIETKKVK